MRSICKIALVTISALVLSSSLYGASNRSHVKILEATEEIKNISQKVVKDYFYLQLNPQVKQTKTLIEFGLLELDEKLKLIATITDSDDTLNLLSFLAYSREQMQETIEHKYDIEQGALMLDYSETLLEGIKSIADEHRYDFSYEEQFLIRVKNMEYLLERINKYYIAYQLGFEEVNNIRQLKLAISSFDENFKYISQYPYSEAKVKYLDEIKSAWPVLREHFQDFKSHRAPNILYITSRYLNNAMQELSSYHSRRL